MRGWPTRRRFALAPVVPVVPTALAIRMWGMPRRARWNRVIDGTEWHQACLGAQCYVVIYLVTMCRCDLLVESRRVGMPMCFSMIRDTAPALSALHMLCLCAQCLVRCVPMVMPLALAQ